jgi:gamma-glutamylcyclotransferase
MASSVSKTVAIYFGYGSNLWLKQMALRCPKSTFIGIARLQDYKWIINERGYANIISASSSASSNEVWGMVYSLTSSDERRLDKNEGVPYAYTKEILETDFWPNITEGVTATIDTKAVPEKKDMLVYIDHKRTEEDEPKEEYIYRMNEGIADALQAGIPLDYVNKVMRKFIPLMGDTVDEQLIGEAQKQAAEFDTSKEDLKC